MAIHREQLEIRLRNACRRLAIPILKILNVDLQEHYCNISTSKGPIIIMINANSTDKGIVFTFLNHPDVQEYKEVKLVGLENVLGFSDPLIIKLIGLPKNQMKLLSPTNEVYFVDICRGSYNKLYNYCKKLKDIKEIPLDILLRLIKRKELLVALYMR